MPAFRVGQPVVWRRSTHVGYERRIPATVVALGEHRVRIRFHSGGGTPVERSVMHKSLSAVGAGTREGATR